MEERASGHPKGLYPLFFTEMWERLAFYLMVGILFLYCKDTERGGLGMVNAAEVYGTYLAFVYFTPFLGGMIADRFLGYRKAVFIGGIFMASGFFAMGIRSEMTLYLGLALICLGNGLFKPNISAMVGNLYQPGDPKRDAGFNIFYMGINIGAAISAFLSAPLRNVFSFNAAFIAAGVGLLVGMVILVANWKKLAAADVRPEPTEDDVTITKIFAVIIAPAAAFGVIGYLIAANVDAIKDISTFAFMIAMIPIVFYFGRLVFKSNEEERPGMAALMPVYLAGGTFFMILHLGGGLLTSVAENNTHRQAEWVPGVYSQKAMPSYFKNADPSLARPDEATLIKVDKRTESMFGARRLDLPALKAIQEKYSDIKVIEDSSKDYKKEWSNLTTKIFAKGVVKIKEEKDSHGVKVMRVKTEPNTAKPLKSVAFVREIKGKDVALIPISKKHFNALYKKASKKRLEPGKYIGLLNAEMITGLLNPVFVVLLTPLVVGFFAWRLRKGKEISTARKIFYGMVITTIALAIVGVGVLNSGDGAAKMSVIWLVVFYAVITVGELCLSPMGLSLVTKLAPKRLVGLMMGGWFLSSAIGNKMSGFISGLTPTAKMFFILSGLILLVAAFIFILLPRLDRAIKKYNA